MKRDIDNLQNQTFDVVIVGGGIYGATAAWDAASRGLTVALIEKGDFGGGTSANSLKTIHGGLRYLQQLDFKRMRESIRERRLLMYLAPHLVHPLSVVMPTYGMLMKSKHVMWAGMLMNDIVSFDRNRNKDKQKKIPACMVISRNTCLRLLPGIDPDRVTGGAFWTDAQMYNSERMLLSFVLSAEKQGAQVANYVQATGFIQNGNQIEGVKAKDLVSGKEIEIKSRMVLNTAGAWVDPLLGTLKPSHAFPLSTAMNLVVDRDMLANCAAGVSGRFSYPLPGGGQSNRTHVLFMAPWRGKTIIGTYHRPYSGNPDDMKPTQSDIAEFLKEVNSAWPGEPVKPEEVTFVQKGFLPMDGINAKSGEVMLTKHYAIHDHEKEDGLSGLLTVVGVKYTTARDVSEKMISLIVRKLGAKVKGCQTRKTRLVGGEIERFNAFMSGLKDLVPSNLSETVKQHLGLNYGTLVKDVLDLGKDDASLLEFVSESDEVLKAEVIYAVRNEMAQKLSDVILRRTDLGSAGHPGKETVAACAELMAAELGWDNRKKQAEIADVDAIYDYQ